MLDEISITITISIPLDVLILLDVDFDCGLETASTKNNITIILRIFKRGLSFDIKELLSLRSDNDEYFKVAWVNLPNLNQKKIANGITISITRNSGSAK
tara:strand:- start:106 stop:402 length:297 start_codon:yes stop_codon:yes gene_type:complete